MDFEEPYWIAPLDLFIIVMITIEFTVHLVIQGWEVFLEFECTCSTWLCLRF